MSFEIDNIEPASSSSGSYSNRQVMYCDSAGNCYPDERSALFALTGKEGKTGSELLSRFIAWLRNLEWGGEEWP